ncbi:MAG: ABC transporter permease subunit [Verrucomicrobia bacterium]|nr:MAG: ABC transporter permease subunit [Verrucomicrobiota bacterium]
MTRTLGISSILLGLLAWFGEWKDIAFPTARWFFSVSREMSWLQMPVEKGEPFLWFGWLAVALLLGTGLLLLIRSFQRNRINPITRNRIKRFCSIRRGYYALWIVVSLLVLAALDQVVVGKRALAVHHDGKWIFPAFLSTDLFNRDFGIKDATGDAQADYRMLKRLWANQKDKRVIMPLIPYDPTGDTLPPMSGALEQRNGIVYESGGKKRFFGLAATYLNVNEAKMHIRTTYRNGLANGPAEGWDENGTPVYLAEYEKGFLKHDHYTGLGSKENYLSTPASELRKIFYHPAPPMPKEGHLLGTTSQGFDLVAYLYGGLQVNFKAAIIYMPLVYLIGITVGMLMGFYGGWFDLISQRLMEILTNVPVLFVVIILASMVPDAYKGLPIILTILMAFGWMEMTYLMRASAYRDKQRDYIAAARVLGASTPRILFLHLIPNSLSIIVTLIPFSLSGLVFALTSLDYLGFGLPPSYATWGRLLNDGLANLSAPWLVTSAFFVLVCLLVLFTFIGEAVREAFDPKKFSYYR